MKPQPYTKRDLAEGERIVRELHSIKGFDGWAEWIAKAIAAERDRVLLRVGFDSDSRAKLTFDE